MNKKFLVVALMAALSSVGYAYDLPEKGATSYLPNGNNSGYIGADKGNKNFNSLAGEINRIDGEISGVKGTMEYVETQVNKKADSSEITRLDTEVSTIKGTMENIEGKVDKNTEALNNKLDVDKFYEEQNKNNQFIQDQLNGKVDQTQMDKVNEKLENKLDKDEFFAEQNKNNQFIQDQLNGKVDKAEQEKVDAEQDKNIAANKSEIERVDKENKDQQVAIDRHEGQLNNLQGQMNQYDGRLSGLEKKVDHLDDKMNKGLSLMAAMNAVDFQNVQTGEMALGAGIGHYGNAQSVALGVAYAPVEDLTVNAKYSITAGDPDSFAVGAGATYKFKVGR